MYIAKKSRKFNGKKFTLVTDEYGTNSKEVLRLKQEYQNKNYLVRVILNKTLPHVYEEGRWFLYVHFKINKTKRT